MLTPRIPSPSFIAIAIVLAASLLAVANFVTWFIRDGLEAALNVDGGGGSTFGIVLLLSLFGLIVGLPIAAVIYTWAPRSWFAYFGGLALFSAIGGRLNSTPILTLEGWLQGVLLSIAFAAIAVGIGFALQRLRTAR